MDKDYTEYTEAAGKGSQGLKICIYFNLGLRPDAEGRS